MQWLLIGLMDDDFADRAGGRRAGTLLEEATTRVILGAFYEVYNELGFGFLESVYQEAVVRVLRGRDLRAEREVSLQVRFRGDVVGWFRADLIVDDRVIVEIKALAQLTSAHSAQLTNYLRATGIQVGLLLNFGPKPEFRRSICTPRPIRDRPPAPQDPRPLHPRAERGS
jgi:GxxExxY protein